MMLVQASPEFWSTLITPRKSIHHLHSSLTRILLAGAARMASVRHAGLPARSFGGYAIRDTRPSTTAYSGLLTGRLW
jgi:hypothetical protein